MKIGMLTDVYHPVINGVTNMISLSKQELEKQGHTVTVFTFGKPCPADHELGVIRSPALPISDTGYNLSWTLSRKAREKLQEMDILHAHHPFISGRLGVRYGRRFDIPIVFTNHTRYDLYLQAYLPKGLSWLAQRLLERIMPAFAAQCDLVIAPSAGVKEVMQKMGVLQEIEVIPNGIDLERLRRPSAKVSRSELDIPADATLLVYCGRLGPEKNLAFLLQAFRIAAEAIPDVHLLLVGGGPVEKTLREIASHMPRVRFTGQVGYELVPAYLAVADVFVTASVTEVHPLSVIEALATGLPVVGIRSPGISDSVRDGVDGYLTGEDLTIYADTIVKLLMEPERRLEMALNARQRGQDFGIGVTVESTLAHYHRLAKPPGAQAAERLRQALTGKAGVR